MAQSESVRHRRVVLALPLLLLVAGTASAQAPRDEAWQLLRQGAKEKSAEARAAAAGVLGLIPGNMRAANMAEKTMPF